MDLSLARHSLTDGERDTRRREGRCMYCGEPGDFVSVCPRNPSGFRPVCGFAAVVEGVSGSVSEEEAKE